eukprot:scaffold29835_cov40-Prasinocladus_malaysianus.AAC.2
MCASSELCGMSTERPPSGPAVQSPFTSEAVPPRGYGGPPVPAARPDPFNEAPPQGASKLQDPPSLGPPEEHKPSPAANAAPPVPGPDKAASDKAKEQEERLARQESIRRRQLEFEEEERKRKEAAAAKLRALEEQIARREAERKASEMLRISTGLLIRPIIPSSLLFLFLGPVSDMRGGLKSLPSLDATSNGTDHPSEDVGAAGSESETQPHGPGTWPSNEQPQDQAQTHWDTSHPESLGDDSVNGAAYKRQQEEEEEEEGVQQTPAVWLVPEGGQAQPAPSQPSAPSPRGAWGSGAPASLLGAGLFGPGLLDDAADTSGESAKDPQAPAPIQSSQNSDTSVAKALQEEVDQVRATRHLLYYHRRSRFRICVKLADLRLQSEDAKLTYIICSEKRCRLSFNIAILTKSHGVTSRDAAVISMAQGGKKMTGKKAAIGAPGASGGGKPGSSNNLKMVGEAGEADDSSSGMAYGWGPDLAGDVINSIKRRHTPTIGEAVDRPESRQSATGNETSLTEEPNARHTSQAGDVITSDVFADGVSALPSDLTLEGPVSGDARRLLGNVSQYQQQPLAGTYIQPQGIPMMALGPGSHGYHPAPGYGSMPLSSGLAPGRSQSQSPWQQPPPPPPMQAHPQHLVTPGPQQHAEDQAERIRNE